MGRGTAGPAEGSVQKEPPWAEKLHFQAVLDQDALAPRGDEWNQGSTKVKFELLEFLKPSLSDLLGRGARRSSGAGTLAGVLELEISAAAETAPKPKGSNEEWLMWKGF